MTTQLEQRTFLDEDGLSLVINTIEEMIDNKVSTATGGRVDTELSLTSQYPVQNKVVTQALEEKAKTSDLELHINNFDIHITSGEKSKLSFLNPAGETLGLIQSGGNLNIINGVATVNGGKADTALGVADNSDFDFGDISN